MWGGGATSLLDLYSLLFFPIILAPVSYFLNKIPPNYKWSKTFLLYGIVVDFDDKNAARELVKVVVIKE